jgi:hypothetical protein
MKAVLPALAIGAVCLTSLSLSLPVLSATTAAAQPAAALSVDARANALRTQFPFLARAPKYNDIPFEYRLVNIAGPKAEKVVDDLIEYGYSDFGTLILTRKEQLPAKLRNEDGTTCTTCALESNRGKRLLEYFVFYLRGLSTKQRNQLVAALEK